MSTSELDGALTHYQVLHVVEAATDERIKQAYRRLTREYHPDRLPLDMQGGELARDMTERFQEIQEAYELLSDPLKRRAYDKALAAWRSDVSAEEEASRRARDATASGASAPRAAAPPPPPPPKSSAGAQSSGSAQAQGGSSSRGTGRTAPPQPPVAGPTYTGASYTPGAVSSAGRGGALKAVVVLMFVAATGFGGYLTFRSFNSAPSTAFTDELRTGGTGLVYNIGDPAKPLKYYVGDIRKGEAVILQLRLNAFEAPCVKGAGGKIACDVMLLSGGRPNPGISSAEYRKRFALHIDAVDVSFKLLAPDGSVVGLSEEGAAGATPGYQQAIVLRGLRPGAYRLIVTGTSGSGQFSLLWIGALGD